MRRDCQERIEILARKFTYDSDEKLTVGKKQNISPHSESEAWQTQHRWPESRGRVSSHQAEPVISSPRALPGNQTPTYKPLNNQHTRTS